VDISGLTNIGQSILVSALKVSDQIEILHDLNDVVVVITGGAVEEWKRLPKL